MLNLILRPVKVASNTVSLEKVTAVACVFMVAVPVLYSGTQAMAEEIRRKLQSSFEESSLT